MAMVRELWTEGGVHILEPPEEAVTIAARPGSVLTASLQVCGHTELAARVESAYTEFVATGRVTFRRRDDVVRLHDMARFSWVALSDGEVVGGGADVLLDVDGRVRADCQFVQGVS